MVQLGKKCNLQVIKLLDFGAYLDGHDLGEILLPIKQVPENTQINDMLDVFLYTDSEDRIIATSMIPFAQVGEFAYLEVADVTTYGAFLNWGLVKHLFVPFKEQHKKMEAGWSYVVYIYIDEASNRIAASSRIEKYLGITEPQYIPDEEVDLLIADKTDLGWKAIINFEQIGMLYKNEIFQPIQSGQRITGYIRKVRPDGKIDLYLNKAAVGDIDQTAERILKIIRENNDFIEVTDKTDPEIIYNTFKVSKKNFKKAIGNLYRNRLIVIEPNGLRATE